MVLEGQARPELLDTYESDRLPAIRQLVRMTERATMLFNSTTPLVHAAVTRLAPVLLSRSAVQYRAAREAGPAVGRLPTLPNCQGRRANRVAARGRASARRASGRGATLRDAGPGHPDLVRLAGCRANRRRISPVGESPGAASGCRFPASWPTVRGGCWCGRMATSRLPADPTTRSGSSTGWIVGSFDQLAECGAGLGVTSPKHEFRQRAFRGSRDPQPRGSTGMTRGWGRTVQAAIPGSRFEALPTGHVAFSSEPEAWLNTVLPFVHAAHPVRSGVQRHG